ncbi:EAL domain-containing protein [Thiomicrorhabdus cannonii]|uniref:EAL domain-containing protein n=1 Tax=Thiomicrorhabdus cannonii TaxID=2748011 RepID=UPI0015BCD6B6|nr:EAL domain-containing protein [Thiomicrorhabdus cannonii]
MKTEQIELFIEALLDSLENEIIQQPSMTHVIHSLEELHALYNEETYWLKQIITHHLDEHDLQELKQIGTALKQTYQLNLSDIFKVIDLAQDYLFNNLDQFAEKDEKERIYANVKALKSALTQGFFEATLNEFIHHLENGFIGPSRVMSMHKNWLLQLQTHFLNTAASCIPEIEHNQCAFAKWLESMEAKLILYASGEKSFDLHGNILLAHRNVHEQAKYVNNYLKQNSYFEALTHFEAMIREFLMLDKYINEAHFNYLSDPYRHFIDFVVSETRRQKRLDYYFVIHFGLLHQSDIYYKRKKEILDSFATFFQEKLKEDAVDFISLQQNESLHVVIREGAVKYDRLEPAKHALKKLRKNFGKILAEPIRVKLFELHEMPICDGRHFDSILQKMARDQCHKAICTIDAKKIQRYRDEVIKDLELLEIVQAHLDQKKFEMHYQPIVDDLGKCQTVEALIRMSVNDRIIPAEQFLTLVENHRLTLEIDQLVFELLKQDIPRLKGITPMINVNIYPQSLGQLSFIQQIIELGLICHQNHLKLMVEITEHEALMHDQVLQELHEKHHILFAIDDFGTGYSNLAKLAELAGNHTVQQAKLDGSLIEGIQTDEAKLRVVRFITDMAAHLGLQPVIAEFVDSKEKLNALKKLPSQILYQGYFFSHVLTLDQLQERFAAGKP